MSDTTLFKDRVSYLFIYFVTATMTIVAIHIEHLLSHFGVFSNSKHIANCHANSFNFESKLKVVSSLRFNNYLLQ